MVGHSARVNYLRPFFLISSSTALTMLGLFRRIIPASSSSFSINSFTLTKRSCASSRVNRSQNDIGAYVITNKQPIQRLCCPSCLHRGNQCEEVFHQWIFSCSSSWLPRRFGHRKTRKTRFRCSFQF